MPIAGVIIVSAPEKAMQVLDRLNTIPNVTTYGVHKDDNIVAVLEGDSPKDLELLSDKIQQEITGVMGIFPAYVNYEDEE